MVSGKKYIGVLLLMTLWSLVTGTVCSAADSTTAKLTLATAAPGVIRYYGINSDGDVIAKPACPTGQVAMVYAMPVRIQTGNGTSSYTTSAFSATAIDNGNQTWTVNVVVVDTEGTAYSGTSKMVVMTRCCPPTGCN